MAIASEDGGEFFRCVLCVPNGDCMRNTIENRAQKQQSQRVSDRARGLIVSFDAGFWASVGFACLAGPRLSRACKYNPWVYANLRTKARVNFVFCVAKSWRVYSF